MNKAKLTELGKVINEAAFMVSRGDEASAVHVKLIKALVLIEQLAESVDDTVGGSDSVLEEKEIQKVKSRLELWANRPHQNNTQILLAYLRLRRADERIITEEKLKAALPQEFNFESNYVQMKIIADRNHGKVFDVQGESIEIWQPVKEFVSKFEQRLLG